MRRTSLAPRSAASFAAPLAALALAVLIPSAAQAASGLYLQLGVGFGNFSGSELVTQEDPSRPGDLPLDNPNECCPGSGLAAQFRTGFSILGFGGPEVGLIANGWNLGGDTGGAGFVGGGLRLFPIKFLSLAGLDARDLPIDFGVGLMFGYAIVGKDFAYTGTFWDLDFQLDYKVTSFMSVGAKLDIIFPTFGDFVFTSYKNERGRCLDSGAEQRFDIGANGVIERSQAGDLCGGRGPRTTFLSPQLVITFHFDLLDV